MMDIDEEERAEALASRLAARNFSAGAATERARVRELMKPIVDRIEHGSDPVDLSIALDIRKALEMPETPMSEGLAVNLTITEDDRRQAWNHRYDRSIQTWDDFTALVRQCAANRRLKETLAEMRKHAESLGNLTGSAWLAASERFGELRREHDKLLEIAFPP